jgi:hypothetical protein
MGKPLMMLYTADLAGHRQLYCDVLAGIFLELGGRAVAKVEAYRTLPGTPQRNPGGLNEDLVERRCVPER